MSDTLLDMVLASGTTLTTPAVWATNFPTTGLDVADLSSPVHTSTVPDIAVVSLADAVGVLAGHFLYDFYYRIWIIPDVLVAQNPQYNTDIPFQIWNAYPQPATNTLESIIVTDGTGLTLDVIPPSAFKAIELRTINIQIAPTAGFEVDAQFQFNFDAGSGTLYFSAEIADFVQMVPQVPVKETWDWLSDSMVAWDGTEQRVAYRDSPRLSLSIKVLLRHEVDYQRQYDRLFKSMGRLTVVPYYQYATVLTQDAVSGDSRLYFDPAKTDMREGEFALVFDPVGEHGYLIKLGAEEVDGFDTSNPITFSPSKNWWIAPAYTSAFKDGSNLAMRSTTGMLDANCPVMIPRTTFKRPGSTASWPVLNGYPILAQRANADQDVPDAFTRNVQTIDYASGVAQQKVTWAHSFVGGKRTYFVDRTSNPEQMDFWRDFLHYCRGMQNPFLIPSYRTDLFPTEPPAAGAEILRVSSLDYADRYHQYQSARRIAIELTDGRMLYREVLTVTNFPTYAELQLSDSFGIDPADLDIAKVSFLNLVRLDSDRVTLTHYHTYTLLELEQRTIDG